MKEQQNVQIAIAFRGTIKAQENFGPAHTATTEVANRCLHWWNRAVVDEALNEYEAPASGSIPPSGGMEF